jgi:hypothetical protein
MKRRSFFATIVLAIGSIFVPRRAQSVQIHTSGYAQAAPPPTEEYPDYLSDVGLQGPVGPCGPHLGPKAFSNRFLSRYEGRPIPRNVVFGQAVGGINQTPFHPQQEIQTVKLKSTTQE